MNTAKRESITDDGEYRVRCTCGFSEYLMPTCDCALCQSTIHPLTKCPDCGAAVINADPE